MEGAVELAEEIFHMPVRLANPKGVRGMEDILRSPIYATGIGLLLYAKDNQDTDFAAASTDQPVAVIEKNKTDILTRMKSWFQGNF